jgi:glycosyltransferase involved in cell wall biosynthesis
MKILCDHQIFSSFAYSGISRYFCELFQEFDQMGIRWDVSCFFSNNKFLNGLKKYPAFFPEWNFRGKNRILESINLLETRRELFRGDFDIFHSTYSKPYRRELLKGKPYVITVHDMTHEKYGAKLPSGIRETAEEKESILRADAVICPSQATADDLTELYPHAAGKVRVIRHGVRIPAEIPAPSQTGEYILYVGSRMFYKNFPTAVRAVALLPQRYKLLCVGGGSFTAAEQQLFHSCGMTERVSHLQLNEPELFAAYRGAAALVFSSEAEGFGLPIIEAQSQNCIPVLSDIACFREIGGEGALYFPVNDVESCAAQLKKALETPPLQTRMQQNLLRFSWQEAARQTAELYRSLLPVS